MNNFIQAFMVLAYCLCMSTCSKTAIQESQSPIDVIDKLSTLVFVPPDLNVRSHQICRIENHSVNINFDFSNCVQTTPNELHAEVFARDGFLYLLLRNQHVLEVSHFEYRDIDDFWVSIDFPVFAVADWDDSEVVRLEYASVLPCIDFARLELSIGSYCADTRSLPVNQK